MVKQCWFTRNVNLFFVGCYSTEWIPHRKHMISSHKCEPVAVIIGKHNKILLCNLLLSTSSMTVFNKIIFVSTSWCTWSYPTPPPPSRM